MYTDTQQQLFVNIELPTHLSGYFSEGGLKEGASLVGSSWR